MSTLQPHPSSSSEHYSRICFLFLLIITGSRDRSSWTMGTSSPSRELGQQTQAHGQVISLPSFEGRFNPAIYLAWEVEVEQVFSHHDFSELESDEDINTIVTPTAPTITYTGPITRARARQLN